MSNKTCVHLAEITRDEYSAFLSLTGNDFPHSYNEWSEFVRNQAREFARDPYVVVYVRTKPDEFAAFCRDRSKRCDKDSLTYFTIWKAKRKR